MMTRRYGFDDIVRPKDREEIERFQQIFGRHIPELLDDEHATVHLHQRLLDSFFLNPAETYRKATFETDLKRFRKAIRTLVELPVWGTKQCIGIAALLPDNADSTTRAAHEIYNCLLTIQDLDENQTLTHALDKLESWARQAAESMPDRRNINWEAVHAVDRLRGFWESWAEQTAPRRALDPSSPFADFLRDAFEFFEIPGDPISAFKRWVALEDAEPHTWK